MVSIDKIKINDAKRLRTAELMSGSLSSIEDEIRMFIDFPQMNVIVVSDGDSPCAMVKMHLLDRKNCHAHLDFVILPDMSFDMYQEIVDSVVNYSLVEQCLHKLTVTVSSRNSFLEKPCIDCGFIQESVLTDEIDNDGEYEDAGLFRILSADYLNYNACFIPFETGVAVVTGGNYFIDGIKLYRYGAKLDSGFVLNVARQLHLVDREGCLLRDDNGVYDMSEEEVEMLPEEVSRAYIQITNYFAKNSCFFDLDLKYRFGTDFQKSVWNAISQVKYGSTRSYEDIALEISDGDVNKAKNLTRAVGNACSDNPFMLVVPCHRIIGKDGKLAGFSAGVEVQDFLLTLEAFTYVTSIT
ncbi:MAG: methylated-DNA--[protein]-cysteine S-methyltransferase [Clostridiales bacterium]|nr:methylated-DNA--[protein]-cysteine S-methyltransferase [Clostridiales bacterium]